MRKLALPEEVLLQIEQPARYIGNEFNSVVKDKEKVALRGAFLFPDVYEIGMSHLGIQILYDMFNKREDMWCERVYSPWPDLDRVMREQNIPLFGLESQEPVKNEDFLFITLQYEMCYTNVLQALDLAGIPLHAVERTDEDPIVIGGGPAGMEAARIAAARGHNVTLYEKRGALGFMLDFAASVKGPHENLADLKNYLIRQLELNGVEVKTGTEVTQELINSEAPDAVILAAGGLRDTLTVDGDGSAPVVEMDNFMFTEMGDNVIVYGSNAQAFDAALWLTVHKKNVTIVTPNPASEFDMQQSQHAMRMMTTALYALGVKSYPQSAIKTVSGNVATLTLDSGVEMNIKCDAIVNGADMLPNTSLVDGIDCKEVYTIGDCANPFNIALAIRGGNDAGRAV